MLELILHVGMGKTGTSSIQESLVISRESLAKQHVQYLGMWFDAVDPRFVGHAGLDLFYQSTPGEMVEHAEKLAKYALRQCENTGAERFILSNEGLYAGIRTILPLVAALRQLFELRIIAYVRNPKEWLPSAYVQWEIFHKVYPGPIRPYAEVGRSLIETYSALLLWAAHNGEILTLRPFRKQENVVEDFATTLGLHLEIPQQRRLEKVDVPEGILRAVYNGRFQSDVLPHRFDQAIGDANLSSAPEISQLIADSFTYEATEQIISEKRYLFDEIREKTGLAILDEESATPRVPSEEQVRARLLEQLLYLSLNQADRIQALEALVAEIRKGSSSTNSSSGPLRAEGLD